MRRATSAIVVMAIVVLIGSTIVWAQGTRSLQGLKPYTPTRLEWLALELNANCRRDATFSNPFSICYVPNARTDAIRIYVRYQPRVDRPGMNTTIQHARKLIKIYAENHGWENWVKIEESVEQDLE